MLSGESAPPAVSQAKALGAERDLAKPIAFGELLSDIESTLGSLEKLGVKVNYDLDQVIPQMDVLYILRIQMERQHGMFFPSIREYAGEFGITQNRLKKAKKDVLVMHPGPVNRGIELEAQVADGLHSAILDQVTNGVAVRMAVLYLVSGVKKS